jgi:hypothetical protein
VDIFDRLDPDTFARRNAERRAAGEAGGQKQTRVGAFDAELLAAAGHAAAVRDAAVCHPSLMYRLLTPFWLGNRALDLVTSHTRHLRLTLPRVAEIDLPERYVAAKFYTGAALPDTQANRRALHELVSVIARRVPVVVLDTGMTTDEHEDYLFRGVPNVIDVRKHLTPQTNLGIQTSVIAGAQGFIGTCGSLAWLAPMLGIDTIAVYADDRFLLSHILFATHVYRQTGAARFDTLDLNAFVQLDLVAAAEAVAARRPPGG